MLPQARAAMRKLIFYLQGGSMAEDFVTVVLRRKTAEELVNAHIIALGDISSGKDKDKGKGKGKKKKDGGGDKYTPPGKK